MCGKRKGRYHGTGSDKRKRFKECRAVFAAVSAVLFLQTLYGMADLFIVGQYARLLAYTKAHGLVAGFSREITLIDYGLTSDPEKFVTEITIPVRPAE